jgi:Holliday junction DNA helicase RuvA
MIKAMISYLRGKIIDHDLTSLVIDVNGIGYKVFATDSVLSKAKLDIEISVWTHLAVRENALDLYGFDDKKEIQFFELLLTISGVGPKSAISIMSTATIDTLIEGIQSNDAEYFSKTSGVGKKTAEKIIVNLKDKIGSYQTSNNSGSSGNNNAVSIDALVALGYSEKDSREAIAEISKKYVKSDEKQTGAENPEQLIKEALKFLGKS